MNSTEHAAAFPDTIGADPSFHSDYDGGMRLKEYAAVNLKVPNSGTDWLDFLIDESRRNELAARAMQALMTAHPERGIYDIARQAHAQADAMIEFDK